MLGRSAEVTQLLIEYGADIEACDIEGERPIHIAAAEDCSDLIVLLAKGGIFKSYTFLFIKTYLTGNNFLLYQKKIISLNA